MGEVPFKGIFDNLLGSGGSQRGGRSFGGISADDKLSIVEELEASGLGWFWATDRDGKVTYLSPLIAQAMGYKPADLIGHSFQNLFETDSGTGSSRSLSLKLSARKSFDNLAVRASAEDCDLSLKISGKPIFEGSDKFRGYRGSALDVTKERRSEEEAARLAKYDSLTGLSNRHRMAQRIDSTLNAFRAAKRNCAIMMLDLDRFKQVNDTLGHAAGDELLRQVSSRLQRVIDGGCEIGRLGGDEFQIMLPDMDDRGKLGEIAKKIIEMLSQPYSVEEGRASIGASVGIAIAPHDGVTREEVTRSADLALYAAKGGGRGQFRFYSTDLEFEANLRKRMEEDLRAAIDRGEFSLAYQPIVSSKGNKVLTLEAQYRWIDPHRGEVSPETFLPIAEGSRLIVQLGEWALKQACKEAMEWPNSLNIALGISSVQFTSDGFADKVVEALKESGLAPERLELQLNESVFLGDAGSADKTLSKLFKMGVRLTLDQFGAGFSSLSYLRRAPFSAIKIGEKFLLGTMFDDKPDTDLIKAIVSLAKAMGMETIANGVESMELLELVVGCGVAHIQGYVFSDALDKEALAKALSGDDWTLDPLVSGSQRASRRTVFRKIGLIHEDHYYEVTMRNLSRSGCMIEGLVDVPLDTQFVVDFGGGQLAVATAKRSSGDTQGLEFEQELVDDGAGGLCTRHRVSPYALASAGAPLEALPAGRYTGMPAAEVVQKSVPCFQLSDNAPQH
ncbi:EAL domain-containing protein [Altererythrobacter sp. MF3-039]|uniref:EAL domain-containing protein n=1 Tax=Altererythrobacter sp. MF3-039 TaxID=3252901 RepID=UPI00390C8828